MKAIVRTQYGLPDMLRYEEVPVPTPTDDEVLIKVYAASVNPLDLFAMRRMPWNRSIPGLYTPKRKVLGCDLAGRVEAAGKNVTKFRKGDEVFGIPGFEGSAFAGYCCAPPAKLGRKPANVSFEEAASVPIAGITALQGLRDKGRIQPGHKVLIEGASGGVGTFAVQIAKMFGAEVTAVCSTRNMDQARSLGAAHVIDYTQENFTRTGQRYDLILGVNAHHSLFEYRRTLKEGGVYVGVGGSIACIAQAALLGPLLSLAGRKKICFFIANINQKDLAALTDLLEAETVVPVIDRRYPLQDAAEALRYLAEGHARGKIVLAVEGA